MSLREPDLFDGTRDKVAIAIARLREFEPPEGYYLAFSGGKDSTCIYELAKMAGVKFDAHYSVTGIDPPELVYHIREHYPEVAFVRKRPAMLTMMATRGFPMRRRRWCCEYLKEGNGAGRKVVTGVRAAESAGRAKRKITEACMRGKGIWYVQPIVDWLEEDVWEFIHERDLPYCKLYDEGWTRIGCLFCPLARKADKRLWQSRYPGYDRAFRRAFSRLHANRKANPKHDDGTTAVDRWANGDEMFEWWLYGEDAPDDDGGMGSLFD